MATSTPLALLRKWQQDSLFRNSTYLMLSTAITGLLGFVFWLLCSRHFTASQVGLAVTFISAATLISAFATLGFPNVIVRFLSQSPQKDALLSLSFAVTTFASIIAAFAVYLVLEYSHIITFHIAISHSVFASLLIICTVSITVNSILDSSFIAYRSAHYVIAKNSITSILKILLVLFLTGLGVLGIVASMTLSLSAACAFGLLLLGRTFSYRPHAAKMKTLLRSLLRFALGNYLGGIFGMLPSTVIPIIVALRLGSAQAAFFYMPFMIATFLNIIPSSIAQSFFAEASHREERVIFYFWKSLRHIALLMIPLGIIVILLAGILLALFGKDYSAEGTATLRVLVVAGFVGAGNYLGDTLLNVKKLMTRYVVMNAINSLTIVVLVYLLVPRGIVWAAAAGLAGQIVTLVIYLITNRDLLRSPGSQGGVLEGN
jgi:O-antigen/teichoic acid export membrane protein